jgi:hypothetical protein
MMGIGEGGLGITLELKTFTKIDMDIITKKDAKIVARAFKDARDYARKNTKLTEPMPPKIETTITYDKITGRWIVWYRDRI